MKHSVFHKMALYQGYDGGKINVNISGGSGVDKNGFTMKDDIEINGNIYTLYLTTLAPTTTKVDFHEGRPYKK